LGRGYQPNLVGGSASGIVSPAYLDTESLIYLITATISYWAGGTAPGVSNPHLLGYGISYLIMATISYLGEALSLHPPLTPPLKGGE